ncbi:MAG: sugar phosphate isomerase/epimerase [Zetaproteobacteria bacterium]|nr:MAG: sugar phosphate isomerase/epimerase [Zetaproteobacteria bacterium]
MGPDRLALHTWTLDTTPLPAVLDAAKATGWTAVELRRLDFARARDAGRSADEVLTLVKGSGLPVACVGVQLGWLFAEGEERTRLLEAFAESCRWARALECATIMSPVDPGQGSLDRAVESVREVGEIAAKHGVRLALEFNSVAQQFNSLERLRELTLRAGHPRCGILLDTYHLGRSGATIEAVRALSLDEIAYVQYSDVPREGHQPGVTTDRLPPGRGTYPFPEFFRLLDDKGYMGYLSYEAPNPASWARDPVQVAKEAIEATRVVLAAG